MPARKGLLIARVIDDGEFVKLRVLEHHKVDDALNISMSQCQRYRAIIGLAENSPNDVLPRRNGLRACEWHDGIELNRQNVGIKR